MGKIVRLLCLTGGEEGSCTHGVQPEVHPSLLASHWAAATVTCVYLGVYFSYQY